MYKNKIVLKDSYLLNSLVAFYACFCFTCHVYKL